VLLPVEGRPMMPTFMFVVLTLLATCLPLTCYLFSLPYLVRGSSHTTTRWVFASPLKPPSHDAAALRRRRALRDA
jgi:hypothetical protein